MRGAIARVACVGGPSHPICAALAKLRVGGREELQCVRPPPPPRAKRLHYQHAQERQCCVGAAETAQPIGTRSHLAKTGASREHETHFQPTRPSPTPTYYPTANRTLHTISKSKSALQVGKKVAWYVLHFYLHLNRQVRCPPRTN